MNNDEQDENSPVEIIEKRRQDFARVGWILDYGLRLRDEKGRAGGKENN